MTGERISLLKMSAENLTAFQDRVAADADLQQRLVAIHQDAARELAQKIAALSVEVGTPFTAEEFLAPPALTDDELDGVAGGSAPLPSGGVLDAGALWSPAVRVAQALATAKARASTIPGYDFSKVAL